MGNFAVSDSNFEEFIDSEELSFVLFKTNMCDNCVTIMRILRDFTILEAGVYFVDAMKDKDLVKKYSVKKVPTVIVFENGRIKDLVVGVTSRSSYSKFLK